MTKKFGAYTVAVFLLFSLSLSAQKKLPPPAIRIQGAPQFTQQELLAAAGLKPDTRVSPADVKARAKQLNDTGLFKEVTFKSDTKGLVLTLTPSTQLYPMHLDNLPVTPGKDLDAKLHDRFPLYRSLLPATGSMVDGICRTFEEMLASKGIKASVKAALTSGLGAQKVTAVNFSIVSPAVHIGRIQLVGVSPLLQAKANLLAAGQTGNNFDSENSAAGLKHVFEDFYQDQGYAAVSVDVAEVDPLVAPDQSLDIPFAVTIKEGAVYKVGTIDFPANALVARADVDKMVTKYPAGSGRPLDIFVLAVRDAYNTRGYLDCSIILHPSFNEATHIVNYGIEIAPGSQYRLASVKFDGAPDPMAAKLKLAWKMAPGAVFDQSYLADFTNQAQKKDKPLQKWLQSVVTTNDFKADPATHQVICVFHFAKTATGSR